MSYLVLLYMKKFSRGSLGGWTFSIMGSYNVECLGSNPACGIAANIRRWVCIRVGLANIVRVFV